MAQEGTSPVPSQDDTHPSKLAPSTTSKTPRTLSFINNVQTAVAKIENKLASSPSASPPPNRNEIPVSPPGPDHPVIDQVQFLESSLAISPPNRPAMSSLGESVFGGAVIPDPSLASAAVFVSTTPRTNLNATVSNPSGSSRPSHPGSQTDTDLINDLTANDTCAAPSIAPIVEQFETPVTPVFSKENDSEIIGAPVAPIVEQFEDPATATDTINQQDLVEFASGTVAPVVDQFEYSMIPEPEANILEQMETSDRKQAASDSLHFGTIEKCAPLPQETAGIIGTDSAGAHDETTQASTNSTDGSQDRSTTVRNLPAVPMVKGLDSLPGSLASGSPSSDQVIQIETAASGTKSLTVQTEDYATAISSTEDNASSELDGASIGKASRAESQGMHDDTGAASESSDSKLTTIASNHSETGKEYEEDKHVIRSETELLLSSEAPPLPSASTEENTPSHTVATTILPTKTCNFDMARKPEEQASSCDVRAAKETSKEFSDEAAGINTIRDTLDDDDSKTTETTARTKLTESLATGVDDDVSVDDTEAEDVETETVGIVTVHGKDDNHSLEHCKLNETSQVTCIETRKSMDGNSTKFDAKGTANETTTAVVSAMAESSDDISATIDAIDNSFSIDETAKTSVRETTDSDEGDNNAASDKNASTEVSMISATDLVDSTYEKSPSDGENTMADEAADKHVTEMLNQTGEAHRSSERQGMDPTVNVALPVTKTILENRASIASESMRPAGRLVENRSNLNSTAENRYKDATTLATEAGTPEIQLDNSMNITIVVQTTSTPVSAGVTISTDDSTFAGKQPTPRSAHNVSEDAQAALEDLTASALEGPASNEESDTAGKAMQENEMVSARIRTVSSAETEATDSVREKDVTISHTNERVSHTHNEEQPAALEQESLDTVTRRALLAREKLGKLSPDRAVKGPCDRSPRADSLPQTDKLKPPGMSDTPCDSGSIASNRIAPCEESISSGHIELRSPVASSKEANIGTGGRTHRQSFSRGAVTPSKRVSTASSVQKVEKKPPQSAPVSPVRLPKSSSQSLPRLPRVAGLSNTRGASSVRSRSSLTEGTSGRIPRSSRLSSSIPRPNSRLSSPVLTRKSGLSLSPVTPKSASKLSRTPRLPLRRTLSFTNTRMLDSPSLASSRTRYSLSQKVEEMKRVSGNRSSTAHLSGSGSKPPLGRRPRLTVPEPFALFGPELHEMSEKQMDDARRRQDEEAARPRVFKPRPMPNFAKPDASQLITKDEAKN